jgi:hypothetical protein
MALSRISKPAVTDSISPVIPVTGRATECRFTLYHWLRGPAMG